MPIGFTDYNMIDKRKLESIDNHIGKVYDSIKILIPGRFTYD
jgi:hypothetical protein